MVSRCVRKETGRVRAAALLSGDQPFLFQKQKCAANGLAADPKLYT